MMMKARLACLITVVLLGIFQDAQGHSGRTDGRGGHHDRISGGYHFHHGMGPHQHPNGVCPYSKEGRAVALAQKGFVDRHPVLTTAGVIAAIWGLRKIVKPE